MEDTTYYAFTFLPYALTYRQFSPHGHPAINAKYKGISVKVYTLFLSLYKSSSPFSSLSIASFSNAAWTFWWRTQILVRISMAEEGQVIGIHNVKEFDEQVRIGKEARKLVWFSLFYDFPFLLSFDTFFCMWFRWNFGFDAWAYRNIFRVSSVALLWLLLEFLLFGDFGKTRDSFVRVSDIYVWLCLVICLISSVLTSYISFEMWKLLIGRIIECFDFIILFNFFRYSFRVFLEQIFGIFLLVIYSFSSVVPDVSRILFGRLWWILLLLGVHHAAS